MHFVIIGQGIAGSMLSWFLIKKGAQVLVIDEYDASSGSRIAGGLLNPITGRRFVKTWMADVIFPFAGNAYRELEDALQVSFFYPSPIYKILYTNESINNWQARLSDPSYQSFLKDDTLVTLDEKQFHPHRAFTISGGYRLDTRKLLDAYREWLRATNRLLEGYYPWRELRQQYANSTIVFCNGWAYHQESPFADLPFVPTKGEVVLAEIENLRLPGVINGAVTLMPTSAAEVYYAGATMNKQFRDGQPSAEGLEEITTALNAIIRLPYKIVGHYAAIRPAVKDRRPLVGFHHTLKKTAIFNGMGTKGYSLAPWLANHFAEVLTCGGEVFPEVNVGRYYRP
ncbi:MAG: FAD-binding oxidoreductase [Chitinophagales bacterium]|nr:FAD-binding oxidoreductase [Chitinophagales bacterium]MDW8418300.1 FAD-dependent oxidoreductase [Chitinophagales bacterium]